MSKEGFSSRLEKPETNDGAKYLYIWFRALGIVMPEKHKIAYIFYSFVVNLFSLVILPLTFTLSFFTGDEKTDISHFLTTFQATLNVWACSSKFVIIAIMRRRLFKIELILEKLDKRISHPEEINEIRKTIKFSYRTVAFFTVVYFSYSTITFLGSVINGRPPYSLYIPFLNWRHSTLNFGVVSVMEYMLIDIACFQEVANDSYAVIYVRMIHCHLKALTLRVSRIGADSKCTQDENDKEISSCVKDHQNILDLMNAVAPVISPTVFVQFSVTAAAMGTTLINIAISTDRSTIMGSFCYVTVLVVEILPICYFVNCLMTEAERLPDAIFHMNWMDQSRQFRQICLYFMHRSQQPMTFFAGKVFPITLNSFMSIIKFAFSLYTLLSEMDFGKRFT